MDKKGFMKNNENNVLARIESQLEELNFKLDLLIKKSSQKPSEKSYDLEDSDDFKSGKKQYKAICSKCKKTCGVPFKPVGGRPVFCSECFASQQDHEGQDQRFSKKPRDFRKSASIKKPFFKKH